MSFLSSSLPGTWPGSPGSHALSLAAQAEAPGEIPRCHISVSEATIKYAGDEIYPPKRIKSLNAKSLTSDLIRDVYRCTMYSINGPRQFCMSVAESADGSKSLSWLNSPGYPGAFFWAPFRFAVLWGSAESASSGWFSILPGKEH